MTIGATTTEGTEANNPTTGANQELSAENNSTNDELNGEGLANDDKSAVNDDGAGTEGKETEEGSEGEEVKIPEKFLNKDGTINTKALAKSYNELEPLQNKYADLSKESEDLRRKAEIADNLEKQQLAIANAYGFNSVEDMQRHQAKLQADSEMAKFEANQYAQFLNLCQSPEDVRDLLVLYAQNPSKELLEQIENEFPPEVHKQIGEKMFQLKADMQRQSAQMEYEQEATKAKTYLETVTTQFPEEFKNKEFVALYGEAFKALGTNLDTGMFVNLLNGLKQSWISEYVAKQSQNSENASATEAIEGLSPKTSQQPTKGGQEKDILSMSPEEMKKEFRKYK